MGIFLRPRQTLLEKWTFFPNLREVALYSPFEHLIELKPTNGQRFAQLGDERVGIPPDLIPTMLHETRHWIDHMASVAGQRLLVTQFLAMDARAGVDPLKFPAINEYAAVQRRVFLNEFYTEYGRLEPPSEGDRFTATFSCGKQFNASGELLREKPILFVRLHWPDGRFAVRVPVSTAALWETSAMAYDYVAQLALIEQQGEGHKHVSRAEFVREVRAALYEPLLARYSVCAHIVSNHTGSNEISVCFQIARRLASIALNLLPAHFKLLNSPEKFRAFAEANEFFKAMLDPGYAFASIALHGRRLGSQDDVPDFDAWVDEALAAAGLPNAADIQSAARHEMDAIGTATVGSFQHRFEMLCRFGRDIFDKLGLSPSPARLLDGDYPLPPIKIGNDLMLDISKWNREEVDKWFKVTFVIHNQMTEYLEACGL